MGTWGATIQSTAATVPISEQRQEMWAVPEFCRSSVREGRQPMFTFLGGTRTHVARIIQREAKAQSS